MPGNNTTFTRVSHSRRLLGILLLLAGSVSIISAQELYNPFLEPEAPEALFQTDLGDAEVDLFALGSWTAGWGTSFGLALHPPLPASGDQITYPYPYPAFERRSFYQLVDLTLSLWLYERYFFETTFLDDFAFNSLLLGYQGREEEVVQYVVAGNSTLSISEYPYLNMGSSAENGPGMAARFETAQTSHELLLRVESTAPASTLYSGLNSVEQRRIEPAAYDRGRYFVLPDGNIDNLRLYLEADEGSILESEGDSFRRRRYKRIDLDSETVYSLEAGTVALRQPAGARLLVYYERNGVPVGSSGLGVNALVADDPVTGNPTDGYEDFSFDSTVDYYGAPLSRYAVELSDGNRALLLYAPGSYNPFERLNRYALDGVSPEDQIELLKRGTSETADRFEDLTVTADESGTSLAVSRPGAGPRDIGNRYPFARPDPQTGELPREARLYGPGAKKEPQASSVQIAVQQQSEVEAITVAGGTVPGTVTVLRNGVPLGGVTVDYQTGEVELPGTVLPGDRIELRYRRYTEDQQYGDLLFASGNRIRFSESSVGEVALGGRWNIRTSNYSVRQGENPGSVTLSTALDYEEQSFSAGVDGALQLYQPDTTGYFRIDGMDNRTLSIDLAPERLLPGSVPRPSFLDEEEPGGSEAVEALSGLTLENRGKLLFKDYSETNALGAELLREYDASIPADQEYPYEADSRRGPYTASADGIDGRVGVADFELPPESWEAVDLRTGAPLDLRNSPEVSFRYSLRPTVDGTPPSREIEVWLQIGYLSEDSDGDAVLDSGDSGVQPLLPFDDAARNITLYAGQTRVGYDRPVTEDSDGNGVLDRGDPRQFVTVPVATEPSELPVERWRRVTVNLSPEERSRLGRTTSFRLIILEGGEATAGNPAVGRLLFTKAELFGSGYLAESNDPDASVSVREGPDPEPGGAALRSSYSTVKEIFLEEGGEQRVLELSWMDLGTEEYVRAQRPTEPVYLDEYGTLRFYAYLAELAGTMGDAALRLTLSEEPPPPEAGAPEGASVTATVPLERAPGAAIRDGWSEISVDTETGEIRVNGTPAGNADIEGSSFSQLRYTAIEVSGAEAGTLYVDEIHLTDPLVRLDGAAGARISWSRPGTIVEARGVPVLRDFAVSQRVNVRSRQFSGATTVPEAAGTFVSTTSSGITLLGVRLEGDGTLGVHEDETSGELGHRISAPAGESPLLLEDTFRRTFNRSVPHLGRSNGIIFSTEGVGTHQMRSEAVVQRTRLSQEWRITSETPTPRLLTLDSELSLYQNAGGYEIEDENYATSWVASYPLLLRWTDGRQEERRGELALSGRGGPESWGILLDPGGSYTRLPNGELRGDAGARITTEWIVPFGLGRTPPAAPSAEAEESELPGEDPEFDISPETPFTPTGRPTGRIAPYYERAYSTRSEDAESGNFGEDLGAYGRQLWTLRYPLTAIPGHEFFLPVEKSPFPDETAALSGAGYTPVVGLLLERPFGSRIADLYYPSTVDLSLSRAYSREEDAVTDQQTWGVSATAAAVNLFGRQGAYPTFQIYRSDEIRNTVIVTILRDLTAEAVTRNYALETKIGLYGVQERTLNYRQRVALDRGEEDQLTLESETSYSWTNPAATLFGIEGVDVIDRKDSRYRHTVSGGATLESGDIWSLELILGHETALEIRETGEIRAYIDLGWTNEPFDEGGGERQHLLGTMVGVEGTLRF